MCEPSNGYSTGDLFIVQVFLVRVKFLFVSPPLYNLLVPQQVVYVELTLRRFVQVYVDEVQLHIGVFLPETCGHRSLKRL